MERAGSCDPDEGGRSRKDRDERWEDAPTLTFGEKELAPGRESIRSGGVRAGDP